MRTSNASTSCSARWKRYLLHSVEASPRSRPSRNADYGHATVGLYGPYGHTASGTVLALCVGGSASTGLGGSQPAWRVVETRAGPPRKVRTALGSLPRLCSTAHRGIGVAPWLRFVRRQWCWRRSPTPRCPVYLRLTRPRLTP